MQRIRERLEDEATPVEKIAAGIDQERRRRDLRGRTRDGITIETVEPGVPHDQSRRAQVRCQELLEPQGRRVASPGKLGHEYDAALLDEFGERFQLGQVVCQRQCAIDRFTERRRRGVIGCSPNHWRDSR